MAVLASCKNTLYTDWFPKSDVVAAAVASLGVIWDCGGVVHDVGGVPGGIPRRFNSFPSRYCWHHFRNAGEGLMSPCNPTADQDSLSSPVWWCADHHQVIQRGLTHPLESHRIVVQPSFKIFEQDRRQPIALLHCRRNEHRWYHCHFWDVLCTSSDCGCCQVEEVFSVLEIFNEIRERICFFISSIWKVQLFPIELHRFIMGPLALHVLKWSQ